MAGAENGSLAGRQVVVTGRLAGMTHAEAAGLIRARGGEYSPHVTARTSLLVVGREGWPLRDDGRLTRALLKARELRARGADVTVATEDELYARLGLASRAGGAGLYDTAQLGKILGVPRDRIRAWVREGLIEPAKVEDGAAYFDFRRVAAAKTLHELTEAGIPPARIRQSLEQLRTWLPDVEEPLRQLASMEGKLVLRLDPGRLAETTGQLRLDFDGEPADEPPAPEPVRTAEEWFRLGCSREDAGRPAEAAAAYRQALLIGGPDADVCYNLANVLHAQGRKPQAAERLWQAVEIDPDFADAWNNLGNVLAEIGDADDALAVLTRAVELEPDFADAHYNLADVLDSLGRQSDARPHWEAYLKAGDPGPWADHARTRLTAE